MPKWIKITFLFMLCVAALGGWLLSGCATGPDAKYVNRMKDNAETHFPRMKTLITHADVPALEQAYGKSPGTWSSLTEAQVGELRQAWIRELDAWNSYIVETWQFIQKEKQTDGK